MKSKTTLLAMIAASVLPASASVTLNTQFGTMFDSSGAVVADGTPYILLADSNLNSVFTGFGVNTSLVGSAVGTADLFFASGQQLSLGNLLSGDTIFFVGSVDSNSSGAAGIDAGVVNLSYPSNGTAAAMNYALLWFPGATINAGVITLGSQVGGINTTSNDGIFDAGMVLPSDGANIATGAATVEGGGSIAGASFQAVNLVPEPSVALLGAIGALGLLRRRRI
jgi:hypothetical protein